MIILLLGLFGFSCLLSIISMKVDGVKMTLPKLFVTSLVVYLSTVLLIFSFGLIIYGALDVVGIIQ